MRLYNLTNGDLLKKGDSVLVISQSESFSIVGHTTIIEIMTDWNNVLVSINNSSGQFYHNNFSFIRQPDNDLMDLNGLAIKRGGGYDHRNSEWLCTEDCYQKALEYHKLQIEFKKLSIRVASGIYSLETLKKHANVMKDLGFYPLN